MKMVIKTKHRMQMTCAIWAMCVGRIRGSQRPTNLYASRRFASIRQVLCDSGVHTTVQGSSWINNGQESKRIPAEKIDEYIADGWEMGRLTFTRVSTIYVTKDGVTKRIVPLWIDQFVADGWQPGQKPREKICVTNGEHNIYVYPDQVPDGYYPGSYKKTAAGRKWVTNGTEDLYLKVGQETPEGWVPGRCNDKLKENTNRSAGKIRINNSTKQKYWDPTQPIPEGWVKGGLLNGGGWKWKKKIVNSPEHSTPVSPSLVELAPT